MRRGLLVQVKEASAVNIFHNPEGTSFLKKDVLEYFPGGVKFFLTLDFLGSVWRNLVFMSLSMPG